MFKATVLISTAALSLAAMASPALAQSFSPINSTTTLSGNLELEQTQIINCDVDVGLSINGSGAASVTSRTFSPGNFFCGLAVQASGTWSVAAGPGTNQVTLAIGASTITGGNCFESGVVVPYVGGKVIFDNVMIDGTPNDCRIDGELTSSPTVTIVP